MNLQKISIVVFLLCAFTQGQAQHQKGDRLVSLTLAPYPTKQNDAQDFGVVVKADATFFITQKLAFVTSGFYSSNVAFQNSSGLPLQAFGIIPFFEYS